MNELSSRITIAIPVHERIHYFLAALESAMGQTVRCRILVMDNASSHNEFRRIVEQTNDPHIVYRRHSQNVGMEENWNSCLREADTEWITILHDDDLLYPGFIERVCDLLSSDPLVGGVAVRCSGGSEPPIIMKRKGVEKTEQVVRWSSFLFQNLSPFPGVVFKRRDGLAIGGFDASLHPSADLDFWIRLSGRTKIVLVDDELAFYRISSAQGSSTLAGKIIDQTYAIRRRLLAEKGKLNFITDYLIHESTLGTLEFYKAVYRRDFDTGRFEPNKYLNLRKSRVFRGLTRLYRRILL